MKVRAESLFCDRYRWRSAHNADPTYCTYNPVGSPSTNSSLAVNLNHFRLLRVVGKGAFGKVRIVERKDTGLTFALKYIRKDEGPSQ